MGAAGELLTGTGSIPGRVLDTAPTPPKKPTTKVRRPTSAIDVKDFDFFGTQIVPLLRAQETQDPVPEGFLGQSPTLTNIFAGKQRLGD